MATQTTVTLIDDLDGSSAVETVSFGLDGAQYEIDLNAKNAEKIRRAFARYLAKGRRVRSDVVTAAPAVRHSREHLAAVRDWARKQGYEVSDRGRVSVEVMTAFDAAH